MKDTPWYSENELSRLADEEKAYRKPDGKIVCATCDMRDLNNAIAEVEAGLPPTEADEIKA